MAIVFFFCMLFAIGYAIATIAGFVSGLLD